MAHSAARRVVFVLFEDCLLLDFAGPLQAFELACETSEVGRAPYVWQVCSLKGGPVKTSSGLEVMTAALSDCAPDHIDTLIVGGGPGVHRAAAEAELVAWFRLAAPNVRRVCSVCTGTFVLAAAGLLQGKARSRIGGPATCCAPNIPTFRCWSIPCSFTTAESGRPPA